MNAVISSMPLSSIAHAADRQGELPEGATDGASGLRSATASHPGRCHLVMLRHVVVAQDIALTLGDADAEAAIIMAGTSGEALAALEPVDVVGLAFVADDPRVFAQSPLALAIAERGGTAVLIGQAAEAEGEALGYPVLARPFTSDAVTALLRRLAS